MKIYSDSLVSPDDLKVLDKKHSEAHEQTKIRFTYVYILIAVSFITNAVLSFALFYK